jgi:hypothetical protein
MSNNDIAELVAPVFLTPVVDGFIEISNDFKLNRIPALETHDKVKTLEVFKEPISENIKKWSIEWNKKPKAFETVDCANNYLSEAEKSVFAGFQFYELLVKKFHFLNKKESTSFDNNTSVIEYLLMLASGIGFSFLVYDSVTNEAYWKIIMGCINGFGFGVIVSLVIFFIIDIPFKSIRRKKYEKNPPLPSPWILSIEEDLNSIKNRINNSKKEIYDDVDANKKLIQIIKERQIEEYFSGKASARILAERLATIQAEVEAAINTTKNLNEQHRLTEEIRLKYAKELVDIQRQVKNENNEDLFNKMTMVNDLLGDAP